MFTQVKKLFTSKISKGVWKDALPSYQPEGTILDMWNGVKETDSENGFGVSNENSNELHVEINGDVRGIIFAEERDQYVAFVHNKDGENELGIIDIKTKLYTVLTKSPDLDINCQEWTDMDLKVMQPCNQLHLYWSSNDTYKKINLDDPCCEFEVKPLIKCDCIPVIETSIYRNGGKLANGTYWFSVRMQDADGNYTNWFPISRSIHISDGDNIPAEESRKAILLKLKGLSLDYNLLDIGVISQIGGIISVRQIDTVSYGASDVNYIYRGDTGRELPLSIEDIRGRSSRYIKGKNLMQYDGRLVLYNLRSEHNLDYQKKANNIKVEYKHYVVPGKYAHLYKGLRPNENYWFGIRWNYCDGTSSADFDIIGREATDYEKQKIKDDCTGCELPRWRLQDTSTRKHLYRYDTFNNFKDDIFIDDFSDDLLSDDVPLTGDEKDSIDELTDADIPTFDEVKKLIDDYKVNVTAQMDCLCEKIQNIPCDFECGIIDAPLVFDLSGYLTLAQLQCMCENRTLLPDLPGGIQGVLPPDIEDALNLVSQSIEAGTCNGGDCVSGTCLSCGSSCGTGNLCGSNNCTRTIPTYDPVAAANGEGRDVEIMVDYALNTITIYAESLRAEAAKLNVSCDSYECTPEGCIRTGDGMVLIESNNPCCIEGQIIQTTNTCIECKNGFWATITNKSFIEARPSYNRTIIIPEGGEQALASGGADPLDFNFENIYDEDGCEIIGVKPLLYSDGEFGYFETKDIYPFTKDCNCEYLYGDMAGKPVRLIRVPSVSKEPYFFSKTGSVPNQYDAGNMEDKDSFVFFTGASFSGIEPPDNLPKPLCKNNPFSIVYVERTEANKSVIGTGVGISCFKGEIQGEPYMFPKHAVNSWERYDRSIEPRGKSTFRGGLGVHDQVYWDPIEPSKTVAPYILHGFDFHANRPPLDATDALFELELFGKGFRHGLYVEDEKPVTPYTARINQKGTRQSVLLNHYRTVKGALPKNYVSKCVKAMEYAPEDSVLSQSDRFTYPLCNLWRESSVYTELKGNQVKFVEGDKQGMHTKYGGLRAVYTTTDFGTPQEIFGDDASDRSFTGDILCHQMPIHDVRAHLITFTRYLPNQYGSPISQVFIPTGLEGTHTDLLKGSISGLVGDSFVGPMSFRRTSYISDKTNRKIAPRSSPGAIAISSPAIQILFGRLLNYIFRSLGLRNGGYIPISCDPKDYVNRFGGLRDQGADITANPPNGPGQYKGEFKDGELPVPAVDRTLTEVSDRNDGDNYWPHLLKTNVWLWLNSDSNPSYRQTGDEDNMEVFWPKLKKLKLDSAFPNGWDWRKTYLTRFYMLWEANPRWKFIFAAILLLVFVWGIGMWMIVQGFLGIINGLQAIGGGTYSLQTIGGVIGAVVGLFITFAGAWWMFYWAKSDLDNNFVEDLIGMKNIKVDLRNPRAPGFIVPTCNYAFCNGNTPCATGCQCIDNECVPIITAGEEPPTYSTKDGKIQQFEDNYWKYNTDLNATNRFEFNFGQSNVYNTCYCPLERSTKISYSNKQNIESTIDAWSNFKLNNYVSIPPDMGKVSKVFKLGSSIFVHTTDMILDLQAGNRSLELDAGKILLGSGNLFGQAVPIYGGVVEGYAGLLDPYSSIVTNWGYIFPDRESKELFIFSGQRPEPISEEGFRAFMHANMGFDLLDKFPDFKLVDQKHKDGIGYSIGVDHQHSRLILTKKDYKVRDDKEVKFVDGVFKSGTKNIALGDPEYFCDNSFTTSYYPKTQEWTGRHSYTPDIYVWDRFDMYAFNTKGMYKHNIKGNYQVFFDELHPFIVEVVVRDPENGFTFNYEGTILDTEAYQWKNGDFIRNKKITFDKVAAYNSFQSTGNLRLNTDDTKTDIINRSVHIGGEVRAAYDHNFYTFNDLRDIIIDPTEPLFLNDCGNFPKTFNTANLSKNMTSNKLSDNFLVYRFTFDSKEDVKLFMKGLYTKVDLTALTV
jgi:hypothetical protein